jgi:hypothetical protein
MRGWINLFGPMPSLQHVSEIMARPASITAIFSPKNGLLALLLLAFGL